MASKNVADLIAKLSADPGLRDQFRADPDGVMDAEGLSTEDKKVLQSGDPDEIRRYLGDDAPVACFILFI